MEFCDVEYIPGQDEHQCMDKSGSGTCNYEINI